MATHLLRFDAKGFEANLILDKLYLGNINAAFNLNELKAMGITHIVTLHNSLKPLYTKHFSYLTIEAEDLYYVNLIEHFEATAKFIDEGRKQGGVLVHWWDMRSSGERADFESAPLASVAARRSSSHISCKPWGSH